MNGGLSEGGGDEVMRREGDLATKSHMELEVYEIYESKEPEEIN